MRFYILCYPEKIPELHGGRKGFFVPQSFFSICLLKLLKKGPFGPFRFRSVLLFELRYSVNPALMRPREFGSTASPP